MLILKRKKYADSDVEMVTGTILWLWQEHRVGGASFFWASPQSCGHRGDAEAAGAKGLHTVSLSLVPAEAASRTPAPLHSFHKTP